MLKIICVVKDSLKIYKYNIKIYDEFNNKIIDDFTDIYGHYNFNVMYHGIYKIDIIHSRFGRQSKTLFINENNNDLLIIFNNTHPITISLVDQNYFGLPIDKGRVILWIINK